MSVTVDADVLVYAQRGRHGRARDLVEQLALGRTSCTCSGPRGSATWRIVIHAAILPRPLAFADVAENVSASLALAHAPGEADAFWDVFRRTAITQTRAVQALDPFT